MITKPGGRDSRWKIESNYDTKAMDQDCGTQSQLPPGLSGVHVESVSHPVALSNIRQQDVQTNMSKMWLSVLRRRRLERILDSVFLFLPVIQATQTPTNLSAFSFIFLLYLTHTKTSGLAEFM